MSEMDAHGNTAKFLEFANLYPRRKRWEMRFYWRDNNLEAEADQIIEGLRAWVGSEEWAKDGGAYVPGMDKFLRNRQWQERPVSTRKPAGAWLDGEVAP